LAPAASLVSVHH